MKKKLFSVTLIVVVAVAVGFTMQQEKKDIILSDMILNNVEALAGGEGSGTGCQWATRETSSGWEAVCIDSGVGYECKCGSTKPYW